jgi:3D (Asp-Asp-Asp) domain-containing protein
MQLRRRDPRMRPRRPTGGGWLAIVGLGIVAACGTLTHQERREPAPEPAARQQPSGWLAFEATAYSQEGKTASGMRSHEGIVAADPKVLPLGTRIRVHDAGPYSRDYVVRDTGRTIKGREIDIYVDDDREAKRFGRKRVQVEVLAYGDGRPVAAR